LTPQARAPERATYRGARARDWPIVKQAYRRTCSIVVFDGREFEGCSVSRSFVSALVAGSSSLTRSRRAGRRPGPGRGFRLDDVSLCRGIRSS
jgi:hypothetical protein